MKLKYDERGLIPVIVQEVHTNKVLMLGYMNRKTLIRTIRTRKVTFWSRSKWRFWVKGETSSNFLYLVSISVDCDHDALLVVARPAGPTCHTGQKSCFEDEGQPRLIVLDMMTAIEVE